jgi:hypothetical protein
MSVFPPTKACITRITCWRYLPDEGNLFYTVSDQSVICDINSYESFALPVFPRSNFMSLEIYPDLCGENQKNSIDLGQYIAIDTVLDDTIIHG